MGVVQAVQLLLQADAVVVVEAPLQPQDNEVAQRLPLRRGHLLRLRFLRFRRLRLARHRKRRPRERGAEQQAAAELQRADNEEAVVVGEAVALRPLQHPDPP